MLAAIVVASLLGVSGTVTPVSPVAAQGLPSPGRLFVTPPCTPVQVPGTVAIPTDLTVSGRNLRPDRAFELIFDPNAEGEQQVPLGSVTTSPYGSFDFPFQVILPIRVGTFRVTALDNPGDFAITAEFTTPCRPAVVVTPTCAAPEDGTGLVFDIRVDGTDWAPDLPVSVDFLGPTPDGYQPFVQTVQTTPDQGGRFSVTLSPKGLGPALYIVRVQQPRIKEDQNIEFRIPCLAPTLRAEPDCAPAGQPPGRDVIQLIGEGYIPNRGIFFEFDPGPNSQDFVYNVDIPESGTWGPIPIEPYQRPDGRYAVIARQYNGPYIALEVRIEFRIPCPEPVATLDPPDCGPPQFLGQEQQRYELVIRGTDFAEGPVSIVFDADSTDTTYPPETFTATVDAKGAFAQAIDPLRRAAGTYKILVRQETRLGPIEKELAFRAPCVPPKPALARAPDCGPEAPGLPDAYTIRIRLGGYIPGPVELIFDADGTPETEIATVGENGRLQIDFTPNGRPAGEYRILAIQRDPKATLAERSAPFTMPCPTERTPAIRIQPANAAPGYVTMVAGTDFPPNAQLTLRWDRGIRKSYTVQCDADGAFRLQVLIFRHDFSGPREMTVGTAEDPAAFPDARARLLVVPGAGAPPKLELVAPFSFTPGQPIVFRR